MKIYEYDEVSSTMDVAKELGIEETDKMFAVVANSQTKGRGSQDRKWASPRGALSLTIGVKSRAKNDETLYDAIDKLYYLSAVASAKTIRKVLNLDVGLKPINDILLGGKKLGGILIEGDLPKDENHNYILVGIGINLNNEIPENLKEIATSTLIEYGKKVNKRKILDALLNEFESLHRFLQAKDENYENVIGLYKDFCDLPSDEMNIYETKEKSCRARCIDINSNGLLRFSTETGETIKKLPHELKY